MSVRFPTENENVMFWFQQFSGSDLVGGQPQPGEFSRHDRFQRARHRKEAHGLA